MRISDCSSDVCSSDLPSKLAMVAFFGLFKHGQIGVLLFLGGPCRTVNALKHLIVAVATPVGAGNLHQLEHLQFARGRHMGASRSEEHTSELQSLMRISYAVFCLKKKKKTIQQHTTK